MGTRRRTYNVLPPATTEWELHLSRSLGDSTSRGYRDLTEFVSRIVERATIRPRRSRSPPPHRSRSAVGRSTHGRTASSNRRRTSRTPPRGRPGRRRSHRGILWNSSPLRSPVRSLTPTPPRVVREVTPGTRRATGRKSPGTAAARTSPIKEKQATSREKVSPEKEKSARRLTPEKQANPTRKFPVTSTSTGSGAGPSASQVHQKSTPKAITRPSAKDLRESIKANREECKRLAKQLQDSVDRRERALADKSEKPRKKFPVSKATVSSSSSSSRSVGTSRASSAGSVHCQDMSPAGSTATIPFTPDGSTQTTKKASVAANRKRTDRVSRDASDDLQ